MGNSNSSSQSESESYYSDTADSEIEIERGVLQKTMFSCFNRVSNDSLLI